MGGNNSPASITAASSNQWRTGWTFGAGVEYAFAQSWCAFVEYNYLDFGTRSANLTHLFSQPNHVPASFVIPIQANATERFNVVKVGLNYRFNWWSTPLVARRTSQRSSNSLASLGTPSPSANPCGRK